MARIALLRVIAGIATACLACTNAGGPNALPDTRLEVVASGFTEPTAIASANGTDHLFVAERGGVVRIIEDGALVERPFLDLSTVVLSAAFIERGLLGMAFHPAYAENGRFYVFYTRPGGVFGGEGDIVIAEYRRSESDAGAADPESERHVLVVDHKGVANHNGGQLAFGPAGYLYIGVGDASSSIDASPYSQDTDVLLGKILRIDIDGEHPYTVPASNPFTNGPGANEVWSYGLRNPWRFSFDLESSDLFIADVGAATSEEVNVQPGDSAGGENYGWPLVEGRACQASPADCSASTFVPPVLAYEHADGRCAIVGGYVYRGTIESLRGSYLYGDACSGTIWRAWLQDKTWMSAVLLETGFQISTFGQDETGDLLVADFEGGTIYRLAPGS